MSLIALANRHIANHYGSVNRSLVLSDDGLPGTDDPSGWINRLMAYVPSEVISAYILVAAIAEQQDAGGVAPWVVFIAFALASPIALWLIDLAKYRHRKQRGPANGRYAFPFFDSIAALLAFIAWASAMPSSPFNSVTGFKAWIGIVAVVTVTFVLNLLGPLFERRP